MSFSLSSELLATYAGLGTHDGEHYYRGEECLACVKDLIRALRADDSRCEIRRELGRARVLQKDLLSILLSSQDDSTLQNDIIRLLVNLTQPAYLCFSGSVPKGKDFDAMRCYMEVELHLRRYKEAFTVETVLNVLGSVLANLCQKDWDHRDDDDIIIIERILLLIRNILHVSPDPQEEKRTEDDVSVHDQIIWNLHINGIDELLLFLGSSSEETQWCMHILEIFFLVFREQSPSVLASTGRGRTSEEKKRDEDLMDEALARERERKAKAMKMRSSRHSRFGGTFVVKNQKSISGSERVYHRPIAGLETHSYDVEKRPRRTNKNKRPVSDVPRERLSTFSIRMVLKNLCVQFLECCYNPLMRVVKDNIRHNRSMENDDTYYLWALRFFMEFGRCHDFRVDIVGETLQLSTFHYLIQLTASYYESMALEKKDLPIGRQWAQRLHYAVQGYYEMIRYIHEMSVSKDSVLCENSKVMISNLVYHQEYRDVFVSLLRNYNEVVQTRSFLCGLVEAAHLYVRMMERYCHGNSHMIVQQKKKKGKSGRKKKKSGGGAASYVMTSDQMTDLWESIDGRVSELMEGREPLPDSVIPFDAASDEPIEEQKITAMARIRAHLIDAHHPEAVALLRAARVVWPDEGFGKERMSVGEEMEVMKGILFNPAAAIPAARLITNMEEEGEEEEEEEEGEEGGGGGGMTYETEFEVRKFIQRFSNNKIVRAYCLILSNYRNNSSTLNHAVVKMLYRIAVDMKMTPLLYQISIFRIFLSILQEPPSPRVHELQKFSRFVVGSFFHMGSQNPLVFVELLVWKTSQDVYELSEGYGALERERARKQLSSMWTREQEQELEELFLRYKQDEDIVACILAGLPGDIPRTRKQVVKQLLSQELITSAREVTKKTTKKTGEWSEEEEALLREVFQREGGGEGGGEGEGEMPRDKDLVKEVATYFPERGIRSVAGKMRELGMIAGRRKKGSKAAQPVEEEEEEEEEADTLTPLNSTGRQPSVRDIGERGKGGRRGRGAVKKKKQKKSKSGVRDVARLVMSLGCHGYDEQLVWLEAYLHDEARDRSVDDEWEEMCIVAVNEGVSVVFRESEFQDLLSALHMQPPSDTEVYWRIPASMTPAQLNKAADSLRPSSILDDGNVESESENEELEQDRDVESESENEELEQDVESESENEEMEQDRDRHLEQEVKGVNEEEVVEGRDDGVKGERQTEPGNTTSDCELVIDYGDESMSQTAVLEELVSRKERRKRRSRGRLLTSVVEPQPKKPRTVRHTNFLDSDSEDEEDTQKPNVGGSLHHPLTGGEEGGGGGERGGEGGVERGGGGGGERERGGGGEGVRNHRKLALSSSSESESDSESRSSSDRDSEDSVGVGGCSGSAESDQNDQLDRDHNLKTDIHSPVMNTVDLISTHTAD